MPGVNPELLRLDNYEIDKSKDALFRGEFEVVKELLAAFEDGELGRNLKCIPLIMLFTIRRERL